MTKYPFGKCCSYVLVSLAIAVCSQQLFAQAIATRETPEGLVRQAAPAPPDTSPSLCGPPADEPGVVHPKVITIVPLQANERLLFPLGDFSAGTLELRYRVEGKPHLDEIIDLDKIQLPTTYAKGAPPRVAQAAQRQKAEPGVASPEAPKIPRVIELLAMEPNTVRDLHRLAREGAAIDLDVVHDGRIVQVIDFADLLSRSAELRDGPMVPVYAPSNVSGLGRAPASHKLRVTSTYYDSCMDCLPTDPCDTECGYDPGKGGPETCGEYGMDCTHQCPSSTYYDFWGPWTGYSSGTSGSICVLIQGDGRSYIQHYQTYRRERIRRTTTCPSAPSCNGCYTTDTVLSYEYSTSYCYEGPYGFCYANQPPCCWTCSYYGWPSCSNSFPCY